MTPPYPIPRRALTPGLVSKTKNFLVRSSTRTDAGIIKFYLNPIPALKKHLGCTTTPWLNKIPSQTKKHAYTPAETTPPTGSARTAWGSWATPAGALTRTRRQDKNPPDDSVQITRGLGGSCRVHKLGVPQGLASTPRLGLEERPFLLLDRPKSLNSIDRSTRFRPRPPSAHLSDRSTSSGSGQLQTASLIRALVLGPGCLRTAFAQKA